MSAVLILRIVSLMLCRFIYVYLAHVESTVGVSVLWLLNLIQLLFENIFILNRIHTKTLTHSQLEVDRNRIFQFRP